MALTDSLTGSLIGFARVSSQAQDLADQLSRLSEAGCTKVFQGKHSGKADSNKEALAELQAYVRTGDTVVVTKLDRLGRSVSQVVTLVEQLQAQGVTVKALDQGIDTSKQDAVSKAMVHMLAMFAEMERSFIEARLSEGKAAAVASGKHTEQSVKGGRKVSYTDEQASAVRELLAQGVAIAKIARDTGMTRQTVYRILKNP